MSAHSGRPIISVPGRKRHVAGRRAQRLAAGERQMSRSSCAGVAADDGDVVAVAADEDMRGAGLAQPPDQADLVVELRPERVDEDRLQRRPARLPARTLSASSRP